MKKKKCGWQFWNAVESDPAETRVLNRTANVATYKPKQRSYRKKEAKKNHFYIFIFLRGDFGRGDFIREPCTESVHVHMHTHHTHIYLYLCGRKFVCRCLVQQNQE